MKPQKDEIVTFKVDQALLAELRQVPNRSEFIRNAIKAALNNVCPLCQGTGVLSPEQKKHWEDFAKHHQLIECQECHELHLVCDSRRRRQKS
ncbi:MAG TPA: ribbon-helix-helix domain-containing protein [bacterium]|nr:ribbon-helix-helix domain-containing protein [bacterium]